MTVPHLTLVPSLAEAAQWTPEKIIELAQTNAATQQQRDSLLLK